jgi:hypothetical protein
MESVYLCAMRKLILAGVATALLIAAPVASANIVIGKSIGGLRLGIAENDVVATIGQPVKATDGTDQVTGQPTRTLDYDKYEVGLTGGVVTFIDTIDKSQKTSNGVRVGITEKKLKKKVKGLKCFGKKKRFCAKGNPKPGGTITSFTIRKKKVVIISLDLVVD